MNRNTAIAAERAVLIRSLPHHGLIVRYARRFLEKDSGESILRGKDPLTAKDVADAARDGDRIALESLTFCMGFLGKMIADVSYVIDPELVIIGGKLAVAGDYLMLPVKSNVKKLALNIVNRDTKIKFSKLGRLAAPLGDCMLIRSHLLGVL